MAGEEREAVALKVPSADPKKKSKKQRAEEEMAVCKYALLQSEADRKIKEDIELLVERICDEDLGVVGLALETLSRELKAATSSMSNVPKPLKFLLPHLDRLVDRYVTLDVNNPLRRDFAMVLAVACTTVGESRRLSLHFCLEAECKDLTSWGFEFLRNLTGQIVAAYGELQSSSDASSTESASASINGALDSVGLTALHGLAAVKVARPTLSQLNGLVDQIAPFNLQHNAEVDAVDLLTEVDRPEALLPLLESANSQRVVTYLLALSKYAASQEEGVRLQQVAFEALLQQGKAFDAMRVALMIGDRKLVDRVLQETEDSLLKQQLALLLWRHRVDVEFTDERLQRLASGAKTSPFFRLLAKELDVLAPKEPDDVFKKHLEDSHGRRARLAGLESAQQNLAASFVNAFVNCGFGTDKLMTVPSGGWLYKNKDRGLLSTTASLGAICLWEVDEALQFLDRHQYSSDLNIKAGALLGFGVASCNVRHECDAALALLKDFLDGSGGEAGDASSKAVSESPLLKAAASVGLGCAYAGSCREDILEILTLVLLDGNLPLECCAFAALSLGLCFVGSASADAAESLLTALLDRCTPKGIPMPLGHLLSVGLGLVFLGTREAAEGVLCAVAALPNAAFSSLAARTVEGLAAAGSGDVLKVQRMIGLSAEHRAEDYWTQRQLELEKQQRPPDQVAEEEAEAAKDETQRSEKKKDEEEGKVLGGSEDGAAGLGGKEGDSESKNSSSSSSSSSSATDSVTQKAQSQSRSSGASASKAAGDGGVSTSPAPRPGGACEEEEDSSAKENYDQAVAVLNIALLAFAEETGSEMALRLYDHILQYADSAQKRAVPLAVALQHPSNPQPFLIDLLSKLSHDADARTALNAIFAMGIVGAGTNHARIASLLRQLASYYGRDANALFVVRLAQGLVYLGKGLLHVGTLHSDRQLVSKVALGSLAIILHTALFMTKTILGPYHFLLFYIFPAVQPRWLLTVVAKSDEAVLEEPEGSLPRDFVEGEGSSAMETDDETSAQKEAIAARLESEEDLRMLPVPVRVGEAVDVVAQVGRQPKAITGFQTHTAPVLLSFTERAELGTDQYLPVASVLEGLVLLRKNPDYKPPKAI